MLPVHIRVLIDEFVISINLILQKCVLHIPHEKETFSSQIDRVNELIAELVYIYHPTGDAPKTLEKFTPDVVKKNAGLKEMIIHQNIDRIIQINSALSYVSTQALSGAVPILERRSLIRRHSLLGIGTAILALNRLTRSIEKAFANNSLEYILSNQMKLPPRLPGLDDFPISYDTSEWKQLHSVDYFQKNSKTESRPWYPKLPYFSGRLSFRESEYTISAAFQSISNGANLKWSLLTLTHEILHGHVRNLFSHIFKGNPGKLPHEVQQDFYDQYISQLYKQNLEAFTKLDSIRYTIFLYCSLTFRLGSLTRKKNPKYIEPLTRVAEFDGYRLSLGSLWLEFENEHKNISEIFVHILDLHYFYGSRISAYIPLIWRSWAETPQVKGDLRQYILRSLLVISSQTTGSGYERFNKSVDLFIEILDKNKRELGNLQVIKDVKKILSITELREQILPPFWASIILVDLVDKVFVSDAIRRGLFSDPLVHWITAENGIEDKLEYRLPMTYSTEVVKKPTAFLFDRAVKQLDGIIELVNNELETAKVFLACCSYLDKED